ncbi:MAG: TrkA family potassium uptake protein [Candidatus Micrarchaeota archaeon]
MKIVIFGGGRVGRALLQTLNEKKHKVTMVDSDRSACDEIAAESNATVVCGDIADPTLLEELKLGETDFVFAVTGNEETNFLVSVYAKHMNAKKVVSRASEAKYSVLMERLGVEPLIPEITLARELANMVLSPKITKLLDPKYSKVEIFEREVDNSIKEKTVADISEKKNYVIISIYEDEKFIQPKPDVVLKEGMTILAVKHHS